MWRVWPCRWGSLATWRVGTGHPAREYYYVFMSRWHPRKCAQTLPDLRSFRLVQFFKRRKLWNKTSLTRAPNAFWPKWKHGETKVVEGGCWWITQQWGSHVVANEVALFWGFDFRWTCLCVHIYLTICVLNFDLWEVHLGAVSSIMLLLLESGSV